MKDSITIMGRVFSRHPETEDNRWFLVTITDEVFLKIQRQQDAVDELGCRAVVSDKPLAKIYRDLPMPVSKVDIFVDDCNYMQVYIDDLEGDPIPNVDLDIDWIALDYCEMVVTHDTVYWQWEPRHTNSQCESEVVDIQTIYDAFNKKEEV